MYKSGNNMACLGDYQEFAMLQQQQGPHYKEPEIMQTWKEIGIFLPLEKEMLEALIPFES